MDSPTAPLWCLALCSTWATRRGPVFTWRPPVAGSHAARAAARVSAGPVENKKKITWQHFLKNEEYLKKKSRKRKLVCIHFPLLPQRITSLLRFGSQV